MPQIPGSNREATARVGTIEIRMEFESGREHDLGAIDILLRLAGHVRMQLCGLLGLSTFKLIGTRIRWSLLGGCSGSGHEDGGTEHCRKPNHFCQPVPEQFSYR